MRFLSYLVRGDTLVIDRWLWIAQRLPCTRNDETLLDVGCGSGAFTIGAARRGYKALGLSWDARNQGVAVARAAACGVADATFEVLDVRCLGESEHLRGKFDLALCCECAEHILDDRKLLRDVAGALKPGGRLLFTSPNYYYRAMSKGDLGPFCTEETGWHVRRGYSAEMLRELCEQAGLRCEEISYCSGWISQNVSSVLRVLNQFNGKLAWVLTLPLRPLALLDQWLPGPGRHSGYSIGMVAVKPRFGDSTVPPKA